MKIRFLYIEGCPHAEEALNLLRQVLDEKGINEEIEIIEIKCAEDAKRYNFLGSPSIQINGIDIEKDRRNEQPTFGCRVYRAKKGYKGIPPKEMIIKAIEEAEKTVKKTKIMEEEVAGSGLQATPIVLLFSGRQPPIHNLLFLA